MSDETNAQFAARMRMKRWCAERRRRKSHIPSFEEIVAYVNSPSRVIPYGVKVRAPLRDTIGAMLYLDTV